MYKLLATSALVAAGLWGMTEAASAQAKVAPISVVVGGYMAQYFGFSSNKDGVDYVTGYNGLPGNAFISSNTGAGTFATRVSKGNKMMQASDTEIWFGGRTTLANGITVGFDVQLEGNSNNYRGNNVANDTIDESYLFLDGAFGRVIMGSENEASYLMHVGAPAPGMAWGANESYLQGYMVREPVAVSYLGTTSSFQNNDAQRLTYFTPRMSGLQFGISYTPNSLEDVNGYGDKTATRTNGWSPAINFTNTFGAVKLEASAGLTYYPKMQGALNTTANGNPIKDWSGGAALTMSGVSVGGGYRKLDNRLGATNGRAYAVGIGYQTGPLAFAASYLDSSVDGSAANSAKDTYKQTILSAAYTMGPGVDLVGAIFQGEFKDEGGAANNINKASGAAVGIRLNF